MASISLLELKKKENTKRKKQRIRICIKQKWKIQMIDVTLLKYQTLIFKYPLPKEIINRS